MAVKYISSKVAKATVDILLVVGFFLSIISSRHCAESWGSFHCIVSMVWYALMLIHIGQHWRITKALLKWRVMKRNIITTLTVAVFILMTISVIFFVGRICEQTVHIHHRIAHVFWAVIIVHAIMESKRFMRLFKRK
jgi:hypothetical protein